MSVVPIGLHFFVFFCFVFCFLHAPTALHPPHSFFVLSFQCTSTAQALFDVSAVACCQ